METIINVFIAIINLAAIIVIYKSLSNLELINRVTLVVIGEIIMYVILFVIYGMSSSGMDETIVNGSRQIILFTFLPINVIGIELPLLLTLKKFQQKDINDEKFKKRMILCLVVSIIILVIEFVYIKDMNNGMSQMLNDNNLNITD